MITSTSRLPSSSSYQFPSQSQALLTTFPDSGYICFRYGLRLSSIHVPTKKDTIQFCPVLGLLLRSNPSRPILAQNGWCPALGTDPTKNCTVIICSFNQRVTGEPEASVLEVHVASRFAREPHSNSFYAPAKSNNKWAMDFLEYLEDYRVIVCRPCAAGVVPWHLATHLWTHHRHSHDNLRTRPALERWVQDSGY